MKYKYIGLNAGDAMTCMGGAQGLWVPRDQVLRMPGQETAKYFLSTGRSKLVFFSSLCEDSSGNRNQVVRWCNSRKDAEIKLLWGPGIWFHGTFLGVTFMKRYLRKGRIIKKHLRRFIRIQTLDKEEHLLPVDYVHLNELRCVKRADDKWARYRK